MLASGTGRLTTEPATLLVTATIRSCLPARLASEPADHSPMVSMVKQEQLACSHVYSIGFTLWQGLAVGLCQRRRCREARQDCTASQSMILVVIADFTMGG